jgi:hypothetical protein
MVSPLEEMKFSDLSQLDFRMYRCSVPSAPRNTILLVRFAGTYGEGSAGAPDALFMEAMATAAVAVWHPDGIVLDLSSLHYAWGDDLDAVLPSDKGTFGELKLPAALVVGASCQEAIRTLRFGLASTAQLSEYSWVHETVDAAIEHVIGRLNQDGGRRPLR